MDQHYLVPKFLETSARMLLENPKLSDKWLAIFENSERDVVEVLKNGSQGYFRHRIEDRIRTHYPPGAIVPYAVGKILRRGVDPEIIDYDVPSDDSRIPIPIFGKRTDGTPGCLVRLF